MADAEATLATLKAQRNALQTNVKKELGKLAQIFPDQSDPDFRKAEASLIKLKTFLDQHQKSSFTIAGLTPAAELDSECAAAIDFEELIIDGIADLTVVMDLLRRPPPPPRPPQPDANTSGSSAASLFPPAPAPAQGAAELSVKLPKLQLDKFDGDPIKWEEFWDGFSTTIHQNAHLSKVDKFKYLKSFLEGDALRMMSGYQLTTANYDTAIEALERRFGNKDIAINAHFEAMLALPEASHSTASLQSTYQSCETHIRSLVALGLSEDLFGKVFTPIILSKMPKFVRMEIHRENKGEPWTLSNLRDLLQKEILVREMSDRTVSLQQKPPGDKQPQQPPTKQGSGQFQGGASKKFKSPGGTTAALVNGASSSGGSKPPIKCAFCQEGHYSDSCPKFPDASSRREKIKGSCYKCLRRGHTSKECRGPNKPCAYCQRSGHHRSLCSDKFGGAAGKSSNETSFLTSLNPEAPEFVPVHCTSSGGTSHRAVLQTALADVVGSGGTVCARLLFDTASSRTFVKTSVSKGIKAKQLGEEHLNIAGFAATKRTSAPYKKVNFNVLCSDGTVVPLEAFETETISCAIPKTAVDPQRFPILKQVKLAEPQLKESQDVSIDILVGCDFYYDLIGAGRMPVAKGLHLIESKLGFILSGRVPSNDETENVSSLLLTERRLPVSQPLLDYPRTWELDDIGIKDRTDQVDDDVATAHFQKTVVMKNGRYAVAWPYKQDKAVLSDNFGLAAGQLTSQLRRLKTNPTLLDTYDRSIKDQANQGIIEPAPRQGNGPVHYLPHHAVVRPDKETTKVRIVYNASAKGRKDDYSLNDCLYRGPVILEDMCGILIRFRFWPVAISSDIEKAFLQIELQEPERDVVRFLWVKDPNKAPTNDNIIAYRFCRVPFGVVSSPFLLAACVRHHMIKADTKVSRDIAGNTYVDNTISGCRTPDDAVAYYQEAKNLFESCSMNLREWSTNYSQFRDQIAEQDRAPTAKPKILGLQWDTKADTLVCPSISAEPVPVVTKRQLLQMQAKLYDPCGFFSAVTVSGKILLQQTWIDGTGWDEPVKDDVQQRWKSYEADLLQIPTVAIDRWYGSGISDSENLEVHTFCDASKDAYAAVVYLRILTKSGIKTAFMLSKGRVKPLKNKITIPRLELLAAVIGVRLTAFVIKELRQPVSKQVLWSDSKCVLQWIPKKQIMPVFVENRLKEIRQHKTLEFRYVPTDQNPADLASRGLPLDVVKNSSLWWNGPSFLLEDESQWPEFKVEIDDSLDSEPIDQTVIVNTDADRPDDLCIPIDQFSSVRKLVNTTAWVLRFCNNARKRSSLKTSSITAAEYKQALLVLIKNRQNHYFGNLWSQKPTPPLISQLKLFGDADGLIRSQGRLLHAGIIEDAKTPILLPSKDHLTKLIVEDAHRSVAHAKTDHTMAFIRNEFWIPKGRSVVRRILKGCKVCRRYDAPAFKPPEQPPLPAFRVTRSLPFQIVGLDYLGPLQIRVADGTEKVWICLFTCAATRAIHLEVVGSLTTAEFLLCLRRFVARYDRPSMIVSDNGTQFRQADRTIRLWWKKLQEADETRDWAAGNQLTWKFIPESAPWMGGFYERLVGLVKNALKKTLERRLVSLVELQTVTAEIASILNTRPLTYVGEDGENPLTPSHFLKPLKSGGFPTFIEPDADFAATARQPSNLILAWKHSQAFLDEFWKIWQNQYLLSLRERGKGASGQGAPADEPQIGSVVLIKEPNLPRGQWRLGRIESLHTSFDGKVRSATMATQGRSMTRPIKLLIPLESEGDTSRPQPDRQSPEPPVQRSTTPPAPPSAPDPGGGTPNRRPRRVAATNAAAITRCHLDDE